MFFFCSGEFDFVLLFCGVFVACLIVCVLAWFVLLCCDLCVCDVACLFVI